MIFVLARAATYSVLFIGFLLIFLPGQILSTTGVTQPAAIGMWQVAGALLAVSGATLASWAVRRLKAVATDGGRCDHRCRG
jgi:hypothetical protein